MLRRFFPGGEDAASPDVLAAVERLLAERDPRRQAELILKHLAEVLRGKVQGYVVVKSAPHGYRVAAVHGFDEAMCTLTLSHGPWRNPGPRVVENLVKELLTPNSKALREQLIDLGLREAKSSLVAPLYPSRSTDGALLLHHYDDTLFTREDLKVVSQWTRILGHARYLTVELQRSRRSMVEFAQAFAEAFESQDFNQLGHAQRVTTYALALGQALELSHRELTDLYFAATLHDLGKLGSSDLANEDEEHPERGANLLVSSPMLRQAAEAVRHHHERWDGSGFPSGLAGTDIPKLARIVAIADQFDLLSSERGEALPMRETEKRLQQRAGQVLDPQLVTIFTNILRQGKSTEALAKLNTDLFSS